MKNKNNIFNVFHKIIQIQFSTNIKALRSDDGQEFFDHVLQPCFMVLFKRQHVFLYPWKKKNIICLSLHIAHIQSTFLGDAILHVIYLMKHITSSQIQNIFEKTL